MPEKNTKPLNQLYPLCRRAVWYFAGLSLVANLLMLTVPLYMLQLFDRVLQSSSQETLIYLTVIAIGALLVFALVEVLRSRVLAVISRWLDSNLSLRVLDRLPDQLLSGDRYAAGLLQDISQLRQFCTSQAIMLIFDSPWVPIYLLIVWLLHPMLGLMATIGSVCIFITALLNEWVTREPLNQASQQSRINQQHITTTLNHADTIQAMGMMGAINQRWQQVNDQVMLHQHQASRWAANLLSLTKFFRLTLQIAILGGGAYLALHGQITPGMMIVASIITARALAPIEQAIGSWKQVVVARDGVHRLNHFFAQAQLRFEEIELPQPKGQLQLVGVSYYPPTSKKPVLNQLNFNLQPGEQLAIIGPSAAGKSTLAKLLVGAYKPSTGAVRLDGADIYHWQRGDIGQHIGYLAQDIQLFSGTVAENIARLQQPDEQAVVQAAQLAGAHEMILQLPKGYQTDADSMLNKLSFGQRQRIGLARAIYGEPQLIVLDEPNAHLDQQGEQALQQCLAQLRNKRLTTVIISHRPNVLQVIDKVLVLINGGIAQFDDKKTVLKKLGLNCLEPKREIG